MQKTLLFIKSILTLSAGSLLLVPAPAAHAQSPTTAPADAGRTAKIAAAFPVLDKLYADVAARQHVTGLVVDGRLRGRGLRRRGHEDARDGAVGVSHCQHDQELRGPGLTLAPGDAFADLTLGVSDEVGSQLGRFTYRLLGAGAAPWQELDADNRLRLQGLEPGDYTLEIRGETGLGTPTCNGLRVPVRARTYWWRRPGMWATLTALLVAVAAGGVYQWQRRRARQREQSWQTEQALRQRLAADLHDDVGNLLTQISLHSSLLRETPHSPAQTAARLDALAAASRQAAQQMSDVVWGLEVADLRLSQLLARMRDHAQEVLSPAGLDVRFQVPADLPDPELAADRRHHLYLIYKEALHNVVKHAQATTLTVQLATTATGLTLTITDDGRGHDGHLRSGGHGLVNMQVRALAIGGTVCYAPLAIGFAVVVTLPLG